MRKPPVSQLWAVVDLSGNVLYTRGGSSTKEHLMVYPSQRRAEAVLKSPWIRQVVPDRSKVEVICIYHNDQLPAKEN